MRINLSEANRPDKVIVTVRNAETSATIPRGTPLILNLTSTPQPSAGADGFAAGYEDGLQVVLPSSTTATRSFRFPYGVALQDITYGQLGEAIIFGVSAYVLVVRATRAASSDSWTSSASSSADGGFLLSIDTVNNAFATYAASSLASGTASSVVSTAGQNPQGNPQLAIMLDSISSFAASATATSDTRTAMIIGYRAFIRMM